MALKIVKNYWRRKPKTAENIKEIEGGKKGLYVLFKKRGRTHFDVVYVGMSGSSVRGRIRSHRIKKKNWDYFSVFEFKSKNSKFIKEVEAIILEIYGLDSHVNKKNIQTGRRFFKKIRK